MNALRRQNIRPQQTFERWMPRTHETTRELARQSETKRKQALQRDANVCRRRRKCNLKMTSLINFTGHPIRHRTPNTNKGLLVVPRTQQLRVWDRHICLQNSINDHRCPKLTLRVCYINFITFSQESRCRVTSDRWDVVWEIKYWGLRTLNIIIFTFFFVK